MKSYEEYAALGAVEAICDAVALDSGAEVKAAYERRLQELEGASQRKLVAAADTAAQREARELEKLHARHVADLKVRHAAELGEAKRQGDHEGFTRGRTEGLAQPKAFTVTVKIPDPFHPDAGARAYTLQVKDGGALRIEWPYSLSEFTDELLGELTESGRLTRGVA